MNLAHLHLLLNHVPTVGFGVGVGLFVASLLGKGDDLRRASLVIFFVVALTAIPAYLSGHAAQFVLRNTPGVSQDVIAAHQDAAMLALVLMEICGLAAWIALWRFHLWHLTAVLVLSIATLGLMARAASIGGEIRHPEILAPGAISSSPAWPRTAAMATALIVEHPWAWPVCEIFHFVGLCLLFGVVLLVSLRTLGFITGVAFADIRRMLPWAVAGLGLNIVTGMLFFIASPDQYTQNPAFVWKMGLVLIGGLTLLYPTVFDEDDALNAKAGSRLIAGTVAAGSILIWVGVIFYGRFLPYLGSE